MESLIHHIYIFTEADTTCREIFQPFFINFAAMNREEIKNEITLALERIIGTSLPEGFGEPFTTAFDRLYPGRYNETVAAGFICSLFLSCILTGFPNTQMHTFVHYANENYGRFSFNCKMYETIYENMESDSYPCIALLDNNSNASPQKCDKKDIFEAFDFYTNR